LRKEKLNEPRNKMLRIPEEPNLPYFVYGALKPGMPAFERLRNFVELHSLETVSGELWVRDGLPMLSLRGSDNIIGFLLTWKTDQQEKAYQAVCDFEPSSQYSWEKITLDSAEIANTLVMRSSSKGNPRRVIDKKYWNLSDDPAFGPGLEEVGTMLREVTAMPGGSSSQPNWSKFFRSQMAYLLLWSILERVSALCIGPAANPGDRIKQLHELPGMEEIVLRHVKHSREVSDSRSPKSSETLDPENAKNTFAYYYQVRCNLSHRGKAVFDDLDIVHSSLRELLAITKDFLDGLQSIEKSVSIPSNSSNPPIHKQP
jgi:hypothetical protein